MTSDGNGSDSMSSEVDSVSDENSISENVQNTVDNGNSSSENVQNSDDTVAGN